MMNLSYRSISYAGILTLLFITAVTLLGEVINPFMGFLKALTGHHWVTKNFFSVIVFVVSLFFFSKNASEGDKSGGDPKPLLWVGISAVACSFVILAFFVLDFLKG
jgi:phosphoglycerol transferase MdoB-like AlkP superfamily enzyme